MTAASPEPPGPPPGPAMEDPPLPTVMVFLRLPRVGRVKTRLAATIGAQAATRIYDELAQGVVGRLAGHPAWQLEIHVAGGGDPLAGEATSASSLLDAASRWLGPALTTGGGASRGEPARLPRFVPQGRGDLGMRMESALRGAFARGAPAACIVASDVPALGPDPVIRALDALGAQGAPGAPGALGTSAPASSVVFGPSPDGGYYLVGLTARAMERASVLFRSMPWSTPEVLALSLDRASRAGFTVRLLESLGDVDHADDLHRLEALPPAGSPPILRCLPSPADASAPMPTHPTPLPAWRERIQLLDVILVVTPNGGSEVTVHLGVPGGARHTGQGAGLGHREGTMRAAIDATLRALTPLCQGRLRLELRGARSVRAFDALLMIVALTAEVVGEEDAQGSPAGRYRLIGTVAAPEDDMVRGTVMAVLDAANRVVEGYGLLPAPDAEPVGPPNP